MYQSYNQQLGQWQKQMVANYHQSLLYQTISAAKLPPGTKATDSAFHQAKALAIIPLSIYKPNEHFAHVTATPNRVVHGTSQMATGVMAEV
ncbi:hypothetical protein Lalb_Chr22g0355621 [Lupinus albus]|uniref:Uncharacterized protein n=1 Tax=Lupinus albus TaxID=3870 RepID=A0A6A4N166_LUPAL|nr:hypothetical protein Lalb_Chr22g0355621 [Lupinus albus]